MTGIWKRIKHWLTEMRCPAAFLCDNCQYDHPSACSRPERPNARKCPDYKPRS